MNNKKKCNSTLSLEHESFLYPAYTKSICKPPIYHSDLIVRLNAEMLQCLSLHNWDCPSLLKSWLHLQVGGTGIAHPFPNLLRHCQCETFYPQVPAQQGIARETLKSQEPSSTLWSLSISPFKRHPTSWLCLGRCFPLPSSSCSPGHLSSKLVCLRLVPSFFFLY